MKFRYKVSVLFILFFILALPFGFSCVTGSPFYLVSMGSEQLRILWNREPIEEVLKDNSLDNETAKKLSHVLSVRDYAVANGLHLSQSYTTLVRLDRDAVAYNVMAVKSDSFEAYTWWFPVTGSVPYLGFFEKEKAEEKAEEFRSKGWDVRISQVAGYSTLGWFNDPLMSPQLKYPEYFLTELVIHECVHETVWLPGSVSFNESFANFYAQEATFRYYQLHDPDLAGRYRLHLNEKQQLSRVIRTYAKKLNQVYTDTTLSKNIKLSKKEAVIEDMKSRFSENKYGWVTINTQNLADREWNNAHFAGRLTYTTGYDIFQEMLIKCKDDLHCFLEAAKELSASQVESFEKQSVEGFSSR